MMDDAIRSFPQQFTFTPTIENAAMLQQRDHFCIAGMGGSALVAGILHAWNPTLDIATHRSYGLPAMSPEELESRLMIVSSYSGNTEEVLDGYEQAVGRGLPLAVVSTGGRLLERAQADGVPYIQLPNTGIQPRMSLGLQTIAVLTLMGADPALEEFRLLATTLDDAAAEERGTALAEILVEKIPVFYASDRFAGVAYNWKIKMNETAKIPAFMNVFPELNHNEMTSFDVVEATRDLAARFQFIFLSDPEDHDRITRRMDITQQLYEQRGLRVVRVPFEGQSILQRIFTSLLTADWTAFALAARYGTESEQVPMVEELKQLLALSAP